MRQNRPDTIGTVFLFASGTVEKHPASSVCKQFEYALSFGKETKVSK